MVMPTQSIHSAGGTTRTTTSTSGVTSLSQRMASAQGTGGVESKGEGDPLTEAENNALFMERLLAENPQSGKEARKLLKGMRSEGKQYLSYVDKLKIVGNSMKALKETPGNETQAPAGLYKVTAQAYTEIMAINYFADQLRQKIMAPDPDKGDIVREPMD